MTVSGGDRLGPYAIVGIGMARSDALAAAHEKGVVRRPYLAEHCRLLDPVRDSPRFKVVLATAKDRSETFVRREAALGA